MFEKERFHMLNKSVLEEIALAIGGGKSSQSVGVGST